MSSSITILKRPRDADDELTQRKFFKKTARGRVVKVLRERYLRPTLPCGIIACPHCASFQSSHPIPSTLPNTGAHYTIPDTNIFLNHPDLLLSEKWTAPLIVLQTVLEEIRHRSLAIWNRLKTFTETPSDDKPVYVFYNELHSDTAVARKEGESSNDRSDRAIRNTVKWYSSHTQNKVVLLTQDRANRELAEKDGIQAHTLKTYLSSSLTPSSKRAELLDLISSQGEDEEMEGLEPTAKQAARTSLYPEHLPVSQLQAGVKGGILHQGIFNKSSWNYLEGSVKTTAHDQPVLIQGRENMNRAVDGDVVGIEIFPESKWTAEADEVLDEVEAGDDTIGGELSDSEADTEDEDDKRAVIKKRKTSSDAHKVKKSSRQPTGRVLGIIKRNWRPFVAHIDSASVMNKEKTSLGVQMVLVVPTSRTLPRMKLRTRQAPSLLGQKILVAFDTWGSSSRYPTGHLIRPLGSIGGKEAEQESLLLEYDIPYRPFGSAILDCLPPEGDSWVVSADKSHEMWRGREDLRGLNVCSIDPPGCQDIDDALHARPLENGNVECGVHIADVSHFVHPATPMDREAASRGTTVYLVDKRIDMLPSLLGTNLCSLRPDVERLAFSVFWEMNPETADVVGVRFTKSVIRSKAAFTYEEAQLRKDDPAKQDDLTKSIRTLNSIAIKLKQKRMDKGALNLASPEVKIHMQSPESSEPLEVEQKALRETNSLVEEFMLLANVTVAQKIEETFPATAVLRRHLPPPPSNFEKLQDLLLKLKGLNLDVSSSGALASSLDKCIDPSETAFNTLVRIMATRCMLSAEYFCSGCVGKDTFGHYGLASDIYTHFTSPIRRFADVLVHRQLSAAISHTPLHASLHSKAHVERMLTEVNRRHRSAQMAGRASVEFYVGLALKARGERQKEKTGQDGVVEEAFVIRAFRNGLGVFVSSLGLEGLVTFKNEVPFDADNYFVTLPTKGGDVKISVFDKVKVKIEVATDKNTQRGKVKMTLVEPIDSGAENL